MADVKKGGIYAAIFAAGMAAGGGGVESLRDPDPTAYLAAGITEAVTAPCADVKQPEACASLRRWQLGVIVEDLVDDTVPNEQLALKDLELFVANKLTWDDPIKEVWVQDAIQVINRRLADGYVKGDISPDDTIEADALVAMLEAARDA